MKRLLESSCLRRNGHFVDSVTFGVCVLEAAAGSFDVGNGPPRHLAGGAVVVLSIAVLAAGA